MKKLIGNTPLIKIKIKFKDKVKNIFAKLEYYNFSGSIKDRIALQIIEQGYASGSLKKGMPIIEATSGNTGIAFASLGARFGHPVIIYMPDWVSAERIKLMQMYGAEVRLVSKADGGFKEAIARADECARNIGGFRPNQFANRENIIAHYTTTAKEILQKVKSIDAFVSGFGTGGTLMGIGGAIKENFPQSSIVAMEPKNMHLLGKDNAFGEHKIEGIGDDFVPELMDEKLVDIVTLVEDSEAINSAQMLACKLGLGVGISSGANFFASAVQEGENIVTVFADDNKKYLSTDLFKKIDNSNLMSNQIEILDMEVL